ncbi:MAG: phospholipase A [Polaromonas sp.]|nr:phospholipase A [Polaromonas sp.]
MTATTSTTIALAILLSSAGHVSAQARLATPESENAVQICAATTDNTVRLECYDQWAGRFSMSKETTTTAESTARKPPKQMNAADNADPSSSTEIARTDACHDKRYSTLSRFWELENGTDCGTFRIRGYRPLSFTVIGSNTVNEQPSSSAANHTALAPVNYSNTETRLQLSMRTKVAQGLLTHGDSERKDSLWFAYSQQSYWQVFSSNISRPFRTTDHEPELVYVYPTDARLPFDWRLRYSGVGLVHQSNGQSLPLSRSWNRVYLMAGVELDNRWMVQARVWKRLAENAASDDNPGIENTVGRAELKAMWNVNQKHSVGLTWLHSLRQDGNGSARLEWLRTIGSRDDGGRSNLRLHTQLFSGYGDSLIDYNRKRTVFSVGLSLLDF